MVNSYIDAATLRELFAYTPATGEFIRIKKRGSKEIGSVAGCINSLGYRQMEISGRTYLEHRLAFLYMTGEWPRAQIDHIDGCRAHNAWANLRDVSPACNAQNQRGPRKYNRSGFLGVSLHCDGKWQARIKIGHDYKSLGLFETGEAASAAYLAAKRINHEGCTI